MFALPSQPGGGEGGGGEGGAEGAAGGATGGAGEAGGGAIGTWAATRRAADMRLIVPRTQQLNGLCSLVCLYHRHDVRY